MGYHSVRLRRGSVLAFAVLLVAAVVGTVVLTSQQPVALPAWSLFNKGIPGGEENQRIEFLRKYGWEAEVPPISEEEIVIRRSGMRSIPGMPPYSRRRASIWINCGAKP